MDINIITITTHQFLHSDHNDKVARSVSYMYDCYISVAVTIKVKIVARALTIETSIADIVATVVIGVIVIASMIITMIANGFKVIMCIRITNNTTGLAAYSRIVDTRSSDVRDCCCGKVYHNLKELEIELSMCRQIEL